jgi:hypothetical protein
VLAAAVAIGPLAACHVGPSAADEARRLEEVQRDGDALTQAADDLEDRMLADQANLLLWQELARRHRQVSAIAIVNHSEHFSSMVELIEHQTEKARKLKRRHVAESDGEPEAEADGEGGPAERQVLTRASAPAASRARN